MMNREYDKFYMSPKRRRRKDVKVREWLMKTGNNFLVCPYVHMAIEANGASPCCMGKPLIPNITGKK